MKKIFILILILFSFNCEDNLSNSIPAFQAIIDGEVDWIAQDFNATFQDNQLSIFGINQLGAINISISSPELGDFDFFGLSNHSAVFQDDQLQYSTENNFQGSIGFHREGILSITEYNTDSNYISGHFYFDAFDISGENTINVSQGVFYRVILSSTNPD
nr:hypothetical protein [uncultured bacterium]